MTALQSSSRPQLSVLPKKATPSICKMLMSQSTEERLASAEVHPPRILEQLDKRKIPLNNKYQTFFQPYPSELIFQNFSSAQTCQSEIRLLNNDRNPQRVKVECQESEYFHVVGPNDRTKFASGMFATFTVYFTPSEYKDYNYRLIFVTEGERFEVPVRAIGPRAILDFQDNFVLPTCPVKASTETTELIYNIGNTKTMFKLHTKRPFSVTPSAGTLDVGDSMQLTLTFNPTTSGNHRQDLILHYDTGEVVYITLFGSCKEVSAHLQANSVLLEKTYVSLASRQNVLLTNMSDVPLRYYWTIWPSQREEALSVLRDSSALPRLEKDRERFICQVESDPKAIHDIPGLSKALEERRCRAGEFQNLILSHGCVTIEPMVGKAWPKCPAQFTIVFKPEEDKVYKETIYCDIEGCKSRLPLTLTGEGKGPRLQLNYHQLDLKNVLFSDTEDYWVTLYNKELIDAPFELTFPDTALGRCFSLSLKHGIVHSGGSQNVKITFKGEILGDFSEKMVITVTGQPKTETMTLRGRVVAPTLNFNVSELDFGDLGFGFPRTVTCSLKNTSYVDFNFTLRVPNDGLGSPSVTHREFLSDNSKNSWQVGDATDPQSRPVEFSVSPSAGSLPCFSDTAIRVTLCPNTVGTYKVPMVVGVEGVGEQIVSLPINARCVVPDIVVETPVLDFQNCFLNETYERSMLLKNNSSVPACYAVLEQEHEESSSIHCGSSVTRGVIQAQHSKEIPVFLLAKSLGELKHTLCIVLLGSLKPPLEVVLSCIGQGPVVYVQSEKLDFGPVQTLTDNSKVVHLSNQSTIPAHFTTRLSSKKSFWRVEPSEGCVPPLDKLDLTVVAHLKDSIYVRDRLEVSILQGDTFILPLSATGTGCSVTSDRPFGSKLNLGTYFSPGSCQYRFKLTNHGQRKHELLWRTEGIATCSQARKLMTTSRPGTHLHRESGLSISPARVELPPGSSVDMVFSTSSHSPTVVRERLICRAIIEGQKTPEDLMSVDVTCRFIAPALNVTPKQLNFSIKKVPGKNLKTLYEKLTLTNVSPLSLPLELSVIEPFSLCETPAAHSAATTKSVVLCGSGKAELWVGFSPAFSQDRVSRVVNELLTINYQKNAQQDAVQLYAEVHFPNLHFSSSTVDFGCVFNLSQGQRQICIKNCSQLPASYRWSLTKDSVVVEAKEQQSSPAISIPVSTSPADDEQSSTQNTVFDILPNNGLLQPGEQQKVTLLYYGQENAGSEVVAQCHVEHGPTYDVLLRGEASGISYSLDPSHIDFGLLPCIVEGEAELTLKNTGKVGFEFSISYPDRETEEGGGERKILEAPLQQQSDDDDTQSERGQITPGQPMVIPSMGHIDGGAEQQLRVLYVPVPEVFNKCVRLKVVSLPHQDITLTGEGVCPMVRLNLPQNLSGECFSDVVQRARAAVEENGVTEESDIATGEGAATEADCRRTYEELVHMEAEKMLIKEKALALTYNLRECRDSQGSLIKRSTLSQFLLPEYVLDFGNVIPGQVLCHSVNITNTGTVAASVSVSLKSLAGTGFSVKFEKVKTLACSETQVFIVTFDPKESNLKNGDRSVVMPIQILHGPMVQVRLCAVVTVPNITVSTDALQFDSLLCGQCQMKAVQLFNRESVPCRWSIAEEVKPLKVDKFMPPHLRKKVLQEYRPPPAVFEMIPNCGLLPPGERVNVQIQFSPTEGRAYSRQLVVSMGEGSQQVFVTAQGQGEEPQLEFCTSVLELGPCLPGSTEFEAEVTIKNPCSFPIEFYSQEFDTQYLEEEKILHLMKGYDVRNKLLLPPREPGEGLPKELLEYYEDYCSQLKDDELKVGSDEEEVEMGDTLEEEQRPEENETHQSDSKEEGKSAMETVHFLISEMSKMGSSGRLGQLEMTPVSRALGRHLCIDLSPEGLAARNCRGIAVVVYGAPLTDKSSTAASLASHYGGACLSVDAVVTDVLLNGTSPLSLSARELYECAAKQYAERKAVETEAEPASHPEASDSAPKEAPVSGNTALALCLGGDVTTLNNVLPEQLLVDVLAERFQQSDCHPGVVIDGLDSLYTRSAPNTLQVVLKALENCKRIYVINLSDSYDDLKERERKRRETEEALEKEKADAEVQQLHDQEYDALPEEEKERIIQECRDKFKQKKLSRELERIQKQQEETRLLMEEEKRLTAELKKCQEEKPSGKKKGVSKKSTLDSSQSTDMLSKSSSTTSRESILDTKGQRRSKKARHGKRAVDSEKLTEETKALPPGSPHANGKLEGEKSCVDELKLQFGAYEQTQEQVQHILEHWDRTQGKQSPDGKRSKKAIGETRSEMPNQTAAPGEMDRGGDKESLPEVIPHIVLNVRGKGDQTATELIISTLPSLEQVLDDLGLGPSGPPIPPPVTFSVVPFPKNRQQSNTLPTCDCFTFLGPRRQDEQVEEKKESEAVNASIVEEDAEASQSDSRSRGTVQGNAGRKEKKGRKCRRKRTLSEASSTSDVTKATEQDQHQKALELKRSQSLRTFRWIVPANDEVFLRIWFYSDSPGIFEQAFNFELLGTQRSYQLLCRGISNYPSICEDYRTLFSSSNIVPQTQEEIQRGYVIEPGYFEFGPLLCCKEKDRHKNEIYPENSERLVIHNNFHQKAEVQFSFQQDSQGTTYLLEPPAMTLKADEKQELTIWAYPRTLGHMKDSIVCSIKDNPEPIIIDVSCWGVTPALQLETNHLHLGRILVRRQESCTMMLHNKTDLPVSWRLLDLNELGELFSVSQSHGIVPSNSSFPLNLSFMSNKPIHIQKTFYLQVSDVEEVLGIIQTEKIEVTAEAYDIILDTIPGRCLEFGTMKVFQEKKLTFRVKNRGKYQTDFRFTSEHKQDSIFTVCPQRGSLLPNENSTIVEIICRPNREVEFKEMTILLHQVIDPTIDDELITNLPVNISVTSVFSRYSITPSRDINFGPLVQGCKKSLTFTIKNTGVFETHFTIKKPRPSMAIRAADNASQEGLSDVLKAARGTMIQNPLDVGIFSVSPCKATLQPGCQHVVTVSCVAEQLGNGTQLLLIDISDRDPADHPTGIPYTLMAEVCKPGIELDMDSIFEEHHMCHTSSQLSSEQFCNADSIYVQEEKIFIFNNVVVGQTAQARFKLTNDSKVPCVVKLSIKYPRAKTSHNVGPFVLSAAMLNIPSQSHSYAVVNFKPQKKKLCSAAFEATIEMPDRSWKTKVLEFELKGEGTLPHVSVLHPASRDASGSPKLQFRRVTLGHKHTLPLVLVNDGSVPAQVQIDMLDKHGVFSLKAAPGNTCSSISSTQLEAAADSDPQFVHSAIQKMGVNEQLEFEVSFYSDEPLSVETEISLQVEGNHENNAIIEVTGEARKDMVSLQNVNRSSQPVDRDEDEGDFYEVLDFGDCYVDSTYQQALIMTNHSSNQALRFEWPPAGPQVCFSPQVGHLHAGCSKGVIVIFCSSEPVTLTSQSVTCKLCQVTFKKPIEEVADWDDKQNTMAQWNGENEVMDADSEPRHSVVRDSQRSLELCIKAVCDYMKYSCNTDAIHFNDTIIYQTSLHQLQMVNSGNVRLEFSFLFDMDPTNDDVDQGDGSCASLSGSSRSSGGETGHSNDALAPTGNPAPISVEPSFGIIEPSAEQTISIRFSPLEATDFQGRLVCRIPNLEEGHEAPCISVFGRSLMTQCHFDLDDSDDIRWVRDNPELRGSQDPNIRVLKFNALGCYSTSTRSFTVLNPTGEPYSFRWRCEDADENSFRCLQPRGSIQPGRRAEVCFEYVADQMEVAESLWRFETDTPSSSVPFLCVGTAREPLAYLDKPHLDFGERLVGCEVEQMVHLVNADEEPFHFSVEKASLLCNDLQQSNLIVQPMTGIVGPKDRFPLSVSFTPCCGGSLSFRLVLRVKGKSEPLAVTVKADCFTMATSVQVKLPDGALRQVRPDCSDTLDFGEVVLPEESAFKFLVTNHARFNLQVKYELTGPNKLLQHLKADTSTAAIAVGDHQESALIFSPQSKCDLQDVRLRIKVKHGPTFSFVINGRAAKPGLEFSFTKHNFGKCFLYRPGMVTATQTLVLTNRSEKDISVQSQFTNTPYLAMDFEANILSPGAVMEVPVKFHPCEASRYHDKLTFIINSSITKHVDIQGRGVVMKLGVEDLKQRRLDLGSLKAGRMVQKQVVLVNRSSKDISFNLLLKPITSVDLKDLSVNPAGDITLEGRGGLCTVHIIYSPSQRTAPFTAKLQAHYAGLLIPMLTLQGCCQGVDVQLDQDHLAFGAVVQHGQHKKRIVLKNTGDVNARFDWSSKDFPPELSITPTNGFIRPGKWVPLEVTFAPVELNEDIRYENLPCSVVGYSSPLTLTVTASCIKAPTSKEVDFVCPVRGSQTQRLQVCNPTNQHCCITPKIMGEQWTAEPSLVLEPLQNKSYEITYKPMTMTANGEKHQGSVFFSFPDGTAMLHSLQGTAEPPKVGDIIVHKLPIKTSFTQSLPVHNWLSKQQRFHVLTEILKPAKSDNTLSFKGLNFIEVPPLAKKDYKLSLLTQTEGQYTIKVTFRNKKSGEYLFYLINLEVTSPQVPSTTK